MRRLRPLTSVNAALGYEESVPIGMADWYGTSVGYGHPMYCGMYFEGRPVVFMRGSQNVMTRAFSPSGYINAVFSRWIKMKKITMFSGAEYLKLRNEFFIMVKKSRTTAILTSWFRYLLDVPPISLNWCIVKGKKYFLSDERYEVAKEIFASVSKFKKLKTGAENE